MWYVMLSSDGAAYLGWNRHIVLLTKCGLWNRLLVGPFTYECKALDVIRTHNEMRTRHVVRILETT